MFCPNCGASLKDGAKFCTGCGQPVIASAPEQPVPPPQQTWQQPQQQWQPQPQQQWQPQQPEQTWQPQPQQPEQWQQPQQWQQPEQPQWQQQPQQQWQQPQQQWQQPQQQWAQPQQNIPPVKTVNKGKRLAAILIPVGAVALIAVLVAVFFQPISNFFRRTVSSPESYYQYVEKRSSERMAEDVGDYYEAFVPEAEDLKNRSVEAELSLTMGDAARELLSESADMDMSWFKDVSVHVSANGNETLGSANVDLNLNGTKVISADGVVDLDAAEAYIRIPLFSDDYLRMTVEELKESLPDGLDLGGLELGNLDLSDLLDMDLESIPLQQLVDAMPKDTEIRELLSKYYKLISDQIENVEKGEQTIEAEGVSQKCTALTATIDGATAKKIVTAVCNELLQDKQVKQIVVRLGSAVAEASGEDASEYGEEAYQELMDKVRDTLENVDELSEGMEEIQHIVFVNKAGETVGRVITASGGVFEYLRPEDGEKYGLRLHFTSEETELTVSGSGVERGGKSSGSFVVELSDEEFGRLEVSNFDKDALKDGNLKGSFAFFPSAKLLQDSSLPVSLPDFGIQLDADCGKDKADVSVTLLQNKNVYLSVAMKILLGHETVSTKLPASAKDSEQWAESVDSEQALESLMNALKKAGMPEELLGSLLSMASGGGTDYYD